MIEKIAGEIFSVVVFVFGEGNFTHASRNGSANLLFHWVIAIFGKGRVAVIIDEHGVYHTRSS